MQDGSWIDLGAYEIDNPYFGDFPQWTPEPLPQSLTNDGLSLSLDRLISGDNSSIRSEPGLPISGAAPRVTRLEFSFHDGGWIVDHHRLQSVSFSDATGNRMFHRLNYLDRNNHAWTTNTLVEITGGLWPGEDAWKIRTQTLQTSAFKPDHIWEVPPITLPLENIDIELPNELQIDSLSIKLSDYVEPHFETKTPIPRIAPYRWRFPSVEGLRVEVKGVLKNRRLVVVEATDQNGKPVRLVGHGGAGRPNQALFFQIPEMTTQLNLKLALPRLKTFEFIARPEFVEIEPAEKN